MTWPQLVAGSGIRTTFSTLSDVNALIRQLGGNAGIAGFYDRRINVTGNPNVTSWADCRTIGAGPLLSAGAGGTTSPTVASAGSPITFVTTSHPLGIANFSGPTGVNAAGPCTVIGVLSDNGASTSASLGALDAPSPSCDIFNTSGGVYGVRFANGAVIASSAVASSATVRCVASSVNSAGTQGFVQVYNQSQVASGAGVSTPGTTSFYVASNSGGTAATACVYSAVIVLNFLASTTQVQAIGAWAVANHSAVAA